MTSMLPVVVVIEDEPHIRSFVRSALEREGWQTFEADNVKHARTMAGTRKPDLLILDLGLPDGDGVDFIREVRQWSTVPIIVLSARSNEADKIDALDAGADDYLTKPFGVGELLARVRSTLRRLRRLNAGPGNLVAFGDVRIDLQARLVLKAGEPVHLTPIEYRLLKTLAANAGKVMTNLHLLREVWGPSHVEDGHYLRIYMANLRQKLENNPAQPRHLLTETAVGYRLLPDRDA